jgi:hypothetical protein
MEIRLLTTVDWNAVENLVNANPTFEGLGKSESFSEKVIAQVKAKFHWMEQVYTYGLFEDDELLAFDMFLKWPNGVNFENSYSIWHMATADAAYLKTKTGIGRYKTAAKILDHAVAIFESSGPKVFWINTPREDENPFRWGVLKASVLGTRNLEIVEEVEQGNTPNEYNWVWYLPTRRARQIVKISSPTPPSGSPG